MTEYTESPLTVENITPEGSAVTIYLDADRDLPIPEVLPDPDEIIQAGTATIENKEAAVAKLIVLGLSEDEAKAVVGI